MPFHSQYGRFGDLAMPPPGLADPDQRAADAIADNGIGLSPRPTLQQTLASKGFLEAADPNWVRWCGIFGNLCAVYQNLGGAPLAARCPASWPGYPAGLCLHELTPPLHHGSLRWLCRRLASASEVPPDNLIVRADGTQGIDPTVKPTWIFVVTSQGEIVTGSEDYGVIKHACLAGGLEIWSAGQLGIEGGTLRLVDLRSGHYVGPSILPGSQISLALIDFTREVFQSQSSFFALSCLHTDFKCVWG